MAAPVLFLLRPTLSAMGPILPTELILAVGLILATLSVAGVHYVVEVLRTISLRPCAEAGCATGSAIIGAMAPAAQSSLVRIENFAIYWPSEKWQTIRVRNKRCKVAKEKRQARKLLSRTSLQL
jgi:hypothetical protein